MRMYRILPVYVGRDVTGLVVDVCEDGGKWQTLPGNYGTATEAESVIAQLRRRDE
jgi:hypothetical protein